MVTLRLNELLGDRSYYWLAQETGIAYSTIRVLASPRSERIYYTTLDKLCDALECTPGDLLVRVSVSKRRLRAPP